MWSDLNANRWKQPRRQKIISNADRSLWHTVEPLHYGVSPPHAMKKLWPVRVWTDRASGGQGCQAPEGCGEVSHKIGLASHCAIGLVSVEFGCWLNTSGSLLCSLNPSSAVFVGPTGVGESWCYMGWWWRESVCVLGIGGGVLMGNWSANGLGRWQIVITRCSLMKHWSFPSQ